MEHKGSWGVSFAQLSANSVGGYTMWIAFFTVALVIAIGLGTASLVIESNTKAPRRLVRRRVRG